MEDKSEAKGLSQLLRQFDAAQHFDKDEEELSRLDESWAKAALFFRTGRRFGHPTGSLRGQSLIDVHSALESRRKRAETNGPLEILQAIALCAEENLPLPTWLAVAYLETFKAYLSIGGPTSLDDAFHGKSMQASTPKKAAAIRQDWDIAGRLWINLQLRAAQCESFDEALTEVLALQSWGVGKTRAREIVLEFDKTQQDLSTNRQLPISQIEPAPEKRTP